jgi:uncharacterized protein DUF7019
MRELVYLSDAKLAQFRPERGRRFRVREVGVPGIGQVGVDPPADAHLDAVVDHLSGIARWYTEDDLAPGDWVQFETSMGYTVAGTDRVPVLLFAEPPGDRRLVLHGSPHHLVGEVLPDVPRPELFASHGPMFQRAVSLLLLPGADGRARLAALLDQVGDAFTGGVRTPVTGYARVTTTNHPGLVVASPLFVAFARQ